MGVGQLCMKNVISFMYLILSRYKSNCTRSEWLEGGRPVGVLGVGAERRPVGATGAVIIHG